MKKYISSAFEIGQIVMIEEEGSLTNLFIPGENRTLAKRQKENAVRFPFPGKSKQRKECGHQTGSEFLKIPPAGEKTRKKRGKFQIISRISLAFSAKGWYNPIILIV